MTAATKTTAKKTEVEFLVRSVLPLGVDDLALGRRGLDST